MMDRKRGRLGVAAMAAALAWIGAVSAALAQETMSLGGGDVAVYNLAGRVEVVAGRGSGVTVSVNRGGRDAGELRVERTTVQGREALIVVYPSDRIVYPELGRHSSNNMRVRSDGTFGSGRGGERVTIRGSGGGLEAWADLRIEVPSGADLAVWVAAGNVTVDGVEATLRVDTGSGRVEANDVTGSLEIDTGSGSVEVRDVTGDLLVDTGSGSVVVEDVRGTEISVDTGSGGVRGASLSAASVRIDTGSGGVDLRGVDSPDVYVDTGSGSVDLDLLVDVESLDVDTGSGSVTVRFSADVGAQLEVETGSGGIDVDFPVELRVMRRDHIVGSVGDGRGRIHVDTGSGRVSLVRR